MLFIDFTPMILSLTFLLFWLGMSFDSYDRGFGIYILFREFNENYSTNSKGIKTEDLTKVDEIEKEIISLLFHCISDSIKVPNIGLFIKCDKNLSVEMNTYLNFLFEIFMIKINLKMRLFFLLSIWSEIISNWISERLCVCT